MPFDYVDFRKTLIKHRIPYTLFYRKYIERALAYAEKKGIYNYDVLAELYRDKVYRLDVSEYKGEPCKLRKMAVCEFPKMEGEE